MCYHCFDVLIYSLRYGTGNSKSTPGVFASQLTDATVECPLFVTWEKNSHHNDHWQLRGCIGTLSPRRLVEAVGEYAEISAFRDRRFRPITRDEVESLRVAVSLLVDYEPCKDAYDWEVGVHGIMILFKVGGQSYSGTYLPEVAKEHGWTIPYTITSLIQKSGYSGSVTTELLKSIQCTRYQSSKTRVTFEEYVRDHCQSVKPETVPLGKRQSDVANTWQSCKPM
jgi:uncharacterized protein (TIGR00296 family)